MNQLIVKLLGPISITYNNTPIPFKSTKGRALFFYLAVSKQKYSRDHLATLFWPESDDEHAQGSLRRELYQINQTPLGKGLITDGNPIAPQLDNITLDVNRFSELIERWEGNTTANDDPPIADLKEIIDLYRGDFLAGFHLYKLNDFEDWARRERRKFRRQIVAALVRIVEWHLESGQYDLTAHYAYRLLDIDKTNETAVQCLMKALVLNNQQRDALVAFDQHQQRLREELDVNVSEEIQTLYEAIRSKHECGENWLSDKAPAGTLLAVQTHGLPSLSSTPFVGREEEKQHIYQFFRQSERRLLTVFGPGGIGKSRLVLEAVWKLVSKPADCHFKHIYFISLSADDELLTLESLITVFATAYGISLSPTGDIKEQLFTGLASQSCLLIIDNGEYLNHHGIALFIDLVQQTNRLQMLITSRELLHLTAEWVLELDGLPFPETDGPRTATIGQPAQADGQQYQAIQLFQRRAAQVDMRFLSAEPQNSSPTFERQAIIRICQLVEGMPLAIELAAVWVRILTCQEIADEIERHLDILSSQQQDRPARLRSIQAVFEHSWTRLTEDEQVALQRLSVFKGAFSRMAANEIAKANLPLLVSLRDKSMLQTEPNISSVNYRMHALLRQFAADKSSSASLADVRKAHSIYYGQFVAAQYDYLKDDRLVTSLKTIQAIIEDIRAGWHQAVSHGDVDTLQDYLPALYIFYSFRSWFHEGRSMFEQAQRMLEKQRLLQPEHLLFATALYSRLGAICYSFGNLPLAEQHLHVALDYARRVEDEGELAFVNKTIGIIHYARGNYGEADRYLKPSLDLIRDVGDQEQLGHTLLVLGGIAEAEANYQRARQYLQECVDCYRLVGQQWGRAHSLRKLADVCYRLGETAVAKQYYQENLQYSHEIENEVGIASTWQALGRIAEDNQEFPIAQDWYQRALTLLQEIDFKRGIMEVCVHLGRLSVKTNHYV